MRSLVARIALVTLLLGARPAAADETDQFLSWGVELRDSADGGYHPNFEGSKHEK